MKIIAWNICGLRKPQAVPEIKFLIKSQKLDILSLLETLVDDANSKKILPSLGFDDYTYVSPLNHLGGIAALWNNDKIHVSVLSKDTRSINLPVFDTYLQKNSLISYIYGPAQKWEKQQFWTQLHALNSMIDIPWCIIGDLNEIALPEDKIGGSLLLTNRFQYLPPLITAMNGQSIESLGTPFTWKRKTHTHLIYERLDRAIARCNWLDLYQEARVLHGCFSCSDHCPITVSTTFPPFKQKAFPFRYQNYWSTFQPVTSAITKSWNLQTRGSFLFRLIRKLKYTKHELKLWTKSHTGNPFKSLTRNAFKITEIEEQLYNNPLSTKLKSWMFRLLKQREKFLLFNQKCWGKLTRKS